MARLRVSLTGDWTALADFHASLVGHEEIELADADADVVVVAASEAAVPAVDASTPTVLVAAEAVPGLVDAAYAAGVAEVLVAPRHVDTIVLAVAKAARGPRRSARAGNGTIRMVFSPKGGTGKTTTTCNLAAACATAGRRTLLLDLDLQFGDAAVMLGLEPRKTLHDLVSSPGVLDADKLAGYVTRHRSGLDVLPAPLRPEDAERISEERLSQLLEVARSVYDVIVVDTSPYFHGPMLTTLERADELLLLCIPDVPTLKNVRLTLHTLELLHFPVDRLRIVLNRADAPGGVRAGSVASVLGRRVDFELPTDPAVPYGVNRGTPAAVALPGTPFARAFAALTAELAGESAVSPKPRRLRLRVPKLALAGGH
jgi:pilus assembly protein CpaE